MILRPSKRIIIVSGIFPPDIGGPASYVPRIGGELARLGHEVSIVCLSDAPGGIGDSAYPFRVSRILRSTAKPLRALRTVMSVWREARRSDLIYVNGLSFEAMLASFLARRPSCHKIVGDYAWERARNRGWFRGTIDEYQTAPKGARFRIMDWIRTTPLRFAEAVIVPSEWLKNIVIGWGIDPARISIVYNASEEVAATGGTSLLPAWHGKTVATVCRLVPWKGVDGILAALAGLPDVRLAVAGDGPRRSELEALAVRLGVADRVAFLGNIPAADVPSLLAASDAFVLNSTYEGLPHVVLEAMHAGIPVVATSVGGTPEVVEDGVTGLLVPPKDDEALRNALDRVLGDGLLAARLTAGATASLAGRFAFRTMVERTEGLLAGRGA